MGLRLGDGLVRSRSLRGGSFRIRSYFAVAYPFAEDVYFVDECGFVHLHASRKVADIFLTQHLIGDDGNAFHNVLDGRCAEYGVVRGLFKEERCLEGDEVRFVCIDVLAQGFGTPALCKGVGVLAFGECQHSDIQAFRQEHVHTTQGGMQSGCVAVVEECDVLGEPVYEAHLARGE